MIIIITVAINNNIQMVAFDGTLPAGLQIRSLGQLQGFLRYRNVTDEKKSVRRIPFAKQSKWVDQAPDSTSYPFWDFWKSEYPIEAVSPSVAEPSFFHNGTGCFMVEGWALFCHLTELLRAAGVDLDAQSDKSPSMRTMGMTLSVQFKLTNWDISDFWSWPIGLKPKYIIEVVNAGRSSSSLYRMYERLEHNETFRGRFDHKGITLLVTTTTSWANFSPSNLISTLVIAAGFLKYANMFVTSVLIKVYSMLGQTKHISQLYTYNARSKSVHEEEVWALAADQDMNNEQKRDRFHRMHDDILKDDAHQLFADRKAARRDRLCPGFEC